MCSRIAAWCGGVTLLLGLLMVCGCSSGGGVQAFQDNPNSYALTVSPTAVTLAPGATQTFTAILTLNGVPVSPQPVAAWTATPDTLGKFTGNIFLGGAPGQQGMVTATVEVGGQVLTASTGVTISTTVPPALVAIEVGPANGEDLSAMPAGCSVQLIAFAVGETGAMTPILDTVAWTVSGGIGTVTPDGVFTATEPGIGKVHATYAGFSGFATIQVICPGEL